MYTPQEHGLGNLVDNAELEFSGSHCFMHSMYNKTIIFSYPLSTRMSFFPLFEFISAGWYLNFMVLLFDIYWHQGLGSGGTGL